MRPGGEGGRGVEGQRADADTPDRSRRTLQATRPSPRIRKTKIKLLWDTRLGWRIIRRKCSKNWWLKLMKTF